MSLVVTRVDFLSFMGVARDERYLIWPSLALHIASDSAALWMRDDLLTGQFLVPHSWLGQISSQVILPKTSLAFKSNDFKKALLPQEILRSLSTIKLASDNNSRQDISTVSVFVVVADISLPPFCGPKRHYLVAGLILALGILKNYFSSSLVRRWFCARLCTLTTSTCSVVPKLSLYSMRRSSVSFRLLN